MLRTKVVTQVKRQTVQTITVSLVVQGGTSEAEVLDRLMPDDGSGPTWILSAETGITGERPASDDESLAMGWAAAADDKVAVLTTVEATSVAPSV